MKFMKKFCLRNFPTLQSQSCFFYYYERHMCYNKTEISNFFVNFLLVVTFLTLLVD